MREDIRRAVESADQGQRLNTLREALQWEVLAGLHDAEVFNDAAFIGGTSLRLLRGLGRFSEGLDFSATRGGIGAAELQKWLGAIAERMVMAGLSNTEAQVKAARAVGTITLRWSAVLKEAGIARSASEKLRINVEVDCRPPAGATLERLTRARPYLLVIKTFDAPSLMAGKINALLTRPYTKGRDWYDLLWYCGNRVEPNLGLLKNALKQFPAGAGQEASRWRESLVAKAEQTNWKSVRADVEPFLARPSEVRLLEKQTVQSALRERQLSQGLELSDFIKPE